MTDDLIARFNDQEQQRYQKMLRLRERGIEPYPLRAARTHTARQAIDAFTRGETLQGIQLAGRLVSLRDMGKLTFAHLQDGSAKIQLMIRKDAVGADAYAMLLKDFDLGDFIGAEGDVVKTKTGEITLQAAHIELLAKTLSPLPEKWHGLKDTETRYRQRYLDLLSNEEARQIFVARSRIVSAMRKFLDEQGFLEVETPALQALYGGAAAEPFVTHHNKLDQDMYLRIADELYLKRLVIGGFDRVYEIGHDFRNEGVDRTHNPEFTMLEFYEAYADYTVMMRRVEALLIAAAHAVRDALTAAGLASEAPAFDPAVLQGPFPMLEWLPSLSKALHVEDVTQLSDAQLRTAAEHAGVHGVATLSRPKLMDELFQHHVESKIDRPTFVVDYPKELSPLAKPKRGNPALTERFELFAKGKELANAFSELNDPIDQRQRFEAQARLKAAGDEEASGVDEDYLRAMEYGMPPMGGVGVGMDRLFMYLTGTAHIRDVILFPTMRPE